jgi:acyl transferase domain-containing protein
MTDDPERQALEQSLAEMFDAPPRPVALLFPGQGAQQARMAAGLYRRDPGFTVAIDEVFDAFGADGDALRSDWLAERPTIGVDEVARAQPLLFAVNYALGRMVIDWGVRPVALLGHSVGEVSAAVLAGVFRLRDAAEMLRERVAYAADAPPGGMLAVVASAAEVEPYLSDEVAIGAVNAPRQTVLAGLDGPLDDVAVRLARDGFTCRRLRSNVAFHSPAAAHIATDALPAIARMPLSAPDLPVHSAYTGGVLDAATARDPRFWAGHAVAPVLFWPTLDALLTAGDVLLVDASPGQALAATARRHPAVAAGRSDVVGLLPARGGNEAADRTAAGNAAARIRLEGHDISVPVLEPDTPEAPPASSTIQTEPRRIQAGV